MLPLLFPGYCCAILNALCILYVMPVLFVAHTVNSWCNSSAVDVSASNTKHIQILYFSTNKTGTPGFYKTQNINNTLFGGIIYCLNKKNTSQLFVIKVIFMYLRLLIKQLHFSIGSIKKRGCH